MIEEIETIPAEAERFLDLALEHVDEDEWTLIEDDGDYRIGTPMRVNGEVNLVNLPTSYYEAWLMCYGATLLRQLLSEVRAKRREVEALWEYINEKEGES